VDYNGATDATRCEEPDDMTAVREIQARTLVAHVRQPDPVFGLKYNLNLYRGCQHRCIYCDSRSECYRIDNFDTEVLVKTNAIELLRTELARKRVKGTIGTGSMNDPYMPLERELNLTGRALCVIAEFGFPIHVITKSDLVLRDLDTLEQIGSRFAAVSFTITTADDELAGKLEPGAPPPSARFHAMQILAEHGIHTGVTMMPILPFIEDDEEAIRGLVMQACTHGAGYIVPWFGMTLRDRQRAYYYARLDALFPGLRQRYERTFSDQYECPVPEAHRLAELFEGFCDRCGIATHMPRYEPQQATQLRLF
jgi:DNA repair photolyase